jgi:hypothetical protein
VVVWWGSSSSIQHFSSCLQQAGQPFIEALHVNRAVSHNANACHRYVMFVIQVRVVVTLMRAAGVALMTTMVCVLRAARIAVVAIMVVLTLVCGIIILWPCGGGAHAQ